MTLRGSVASFPLETIVQLLAATGKTGQLEVRAGRDSGVLGFDQGRLVAATSEEDHGDAALGAVFTMTDGEFEFVPWGDPPPANLAGELNQLLDRAVEQRDKIIQDRAIIPNDRARFRLSDRAANQGEVRLSADQWRTLLAVNGERDVNGIAAQLSAGRLATLAVLADLVRGGIVDVIEPGPEREPEPPAPPPSSFTPRSYEPPAEPTSFGSAAASAAPAWDVPPTRSWEPAAPPPPPEAPPSWEAAPVREAPAWEPRSEPLPAQSWEQTAAPPLEPPAWQEPARPEVPPSWDQQPAAPEPPAWDQRPAAEAPPAWDQPAATEPPAWAPPEPSAPASGAGDRWWERPGASGAGTTEWRAPTVEPSQPAPTEQPTETVVDDRLSALTGVFGETSEPVPPMWQPQPPGEVADPRLSAFPSAPVFPQAPVTETPAPPAREEKKRGGLFGGLFGGSKREEAAPMPEATPTISLRQPRERAGKLAAFANGLLDEFNNGQYGKGRIDDRMTDLLMRVDEQADPIDRPLPIVDDRIDVPAIERQQMPDRQVAPYLALLVTQIYEDAERAFGKNNAKRGYKAAQQKVLGGDTGALGTDLSLPRV